MESQPKKSRTIQSPPSSRPPTVPLMWVHDTMLHKHPTREGDINLRSAYTIIQSRIYTPKNPATPTSKPKKSAEGAKQLRFKNPAALDNHFDIPTKIRVMENQEHLDDHVNRVQILQKEVMHILEQPIGSVLQDMVLFRGGVVDDDSYEFSKQDMNKIALTVEDTLLNTLYDSAFVELHADAPYSRDTDKQYVERLFQYRDYLIQHIRSPFYSVVKDAFHSSLEYIYDDLIQISKDTGKKYTRDTVPSIVRKYLESKQDVPMSLQQSIDGFIYQHGQTVKNKPNLQSLLLEIAKIINGYLSFHSMTFEYITLLVLLRFITQRSRISCRNACSPVNNGVFEGDVNVGKACEQLYTHMNGVLAESEIRFFIEALKYASDEKCVLLTMQGGNQNTIHVGSRGGKYIVVKGKKKYI